MAEVGTLAEGFTGVTGADGDHITYCRICEALCGMVATVRDGLVVKIRPDPDNPHSRGHICVKGPAIAEVTNDPDRVVHPLRRVGPPGMFEWVSWDEALDDIARRLTALLRDHGPAAFGLIYGNPPAFGMASVMAPALFQKALGASKSFSPQSEDTASVLLANQFVFGGTSYVFPDLPACEHLLIFGSNPLVSHGSLMIAPRIKEDLDAIAARGRVIVIDPRRTETARKFEHVPVVPATDAWLIGAMITVIADEGLANEAFLAARTSGWPALRQALRAVTPERAAVHCGVPAEEIRILALDFARADRAAAMGRLGLCRGRFPTLTNVLLHALNIVAGKFNRPGCAGFGHGATDSGDMLDAAGMAGYTPGASRTSGLPAVVGSLPSVTLYDEITGPHPERIRAMLVSGSNAVLSMPGGSRLPEAFAQLDLMFALDIYVTETNRHAHYILPATTMLERDDAPILFGGHMVRPFMQFCPAAVRPRGEARVESDILKDLAARMGRGEAFGDLGAVEIADLVLRAGPEGDNGPEKLSIERLRAHPHGIMLRSGRWAFALKDKIRHEDGRIHLFDPLVAAELKRLVAEPPDAGQGLKMVSLRKLRSINSWMHNVERLVRSDGPRLLINPADAAARGLVDGARVRVSTRWGAITVIAEVTDEIAPGAVAYPHGWGHEGGWRRANGTMGANLNTIAPASPDAVEQVSGMSFLDGFPVEVELADDRQVTETILGTSLGNDLGTS
jgi:anaerobic selenocysteine-containing dehydrogenase